MNKDYYKPYEGRDIQILDQHAANTIAEDHLTFPYQLLDHLAHVLMLKEQGIISPEDAAQILRAVLKLRREGPDIVPRKHGLTDLYSNVEEWVIDQVGIQVGGKLHTGRSRNDMNPAIERMYIRKKLLEQMEAITFLMETLLVQAEAHKNTIIPAYTHHSQQAQPITLGHFYMSAFENFGRDMERLMHAYEHVDLSPMGAAAVATTGFPISRERVAELLGFQKPMDNSLDGVSDRDFAIEFLSACSILMMHLSRFSEELILWCSWEFKFLELDDAYATGSSIMPQKKNPDVAELVRGKTGRVYGSLITLLTVMKGIPLAYNKDMQEDKEPVFDTIDTVELCLPVFTAMIDTLTVNRDNMRAAANGGFISATDCADYLAKKGMPFREAYGIVGKLVGHCVDTGHSLETLPLEEYQKVSPYFEEDVYEALSLETCVGGRKVYGGPAPEAVQVQIEAMKSFVQEREG